MLFCPIFQTCQGRENGHNGSGSLAENLEKQIEQERETKMTEVWKSNYLKKSVVGLQVVICAVINIVI